MSLLVEAVNYSLAAILMGIVGAWLVLLRSMLASFRYTPYLDGFQKTSHGAPMVSVILPARNEEGFIAKCLGSLVEQDYENYEVIAVDDSSEDDTGDIIREYARKDSRVVHVRAGQKPDGWMGKNWACIEGYKRAAGELLLFTDSDTRHEPNVVSLAVGHLLSSKLDALTAMPKMLSLDFWTGITLPVISVFLHTRFSALRVNDPAKNTGYFFGSFFIIRREVYEGVGTHEGVRQEIIEDGALGRKVKEAGHKMKMVRGDHLIDAVWARDGPTLWNALKRLMIPLYLQSSTVAVGAFLAVLFLLFMPFPLLGYAVLGFDGGASSSLLLLFSSLASLVIYAGAVIESARGLCARLEYAMMCPLGGLVVVSGFMSGLVRAKSDAAVSWRGRIYSMKDHAQSAISV